MKTYRFRSLLAAWALEAVVAQISGSADKAGLCVSKQTLSNVRAARPHKHISFMINNNSLILIPQREACQGCGACGWMVFYKLVGNGPGFSLWPAVN